MFAHVCVLLYFIRLIGKKLIFQHGFNYHNGSQADRSVQKLKDILCPGFAADMMHSASKYILPGFTVVMFRK
jgi:hypothetical protein